MSSRNLLPWNLYTKTVLKSPNEIYRSLKDRNLLTPEGITNKALVLDEIRELLGSMSSPALASGESAFLEAELKFVHSRFISMNQTDGSLSTSENYLIPGNLTERDLPQGYEIVKYFSSHVARVRVNLSGEEDGTIVERLVKKTPEGQDHEIRILNLINAHWTEEHGNNARPPFPTEIRELGPNVFEEEFIYSRPVIPAPDEQPHPIFNRLEPLFEAVHWLHQQGVVHGDINLNNVLATTSSIRLIDFGNARCPGIHEEFFRSGTPGYRAPEAYDTKPNRRMDIFSLGATLHMLFWGTLPYNDDYQPTGSAGISNKDLKAVVDQATHLNPDQRHATVQQLNQDLKQVLGLDS